MLRSSAALAVLTAALLLVPDLAAQVPVPPQAGLPATGARPLPQAEEVLEAFIAATGGREAWEKHTSHVLRLEGTMPETGLAVTMIVKAKAPNLFVMRSEVKGLMDQDAGYDGQVAWMKSARTGLRRLEGPAKAALLREATFNAALRWRDLYTAVRTKEIKTIDGQECAVVELVPAAGEPVLEAYALQSRLLLRRDQVQDAVEGKQRLTTVLADYREVEGVKMPHALKLQAGLQTMSLKVVGVEVNAALEATTFRMPPEEEPPPGEGKGAVPGGRKG